MTAATSAADWIASGATVAGAAGTAVAAWFAYKAAKSSTETVREVRTAHAVAVRPNLVVGSVGYYGPGDVDEQAFGVVLNNDGEEDAVDVEVTAELRDGGTCTGSVPLVPGQRADPGDRWRLVALTPVPPGLPENRSAWEWEPLQDLRMSLRRVIVVFADAERRGRWERTFETIEATDAGMGVNYPHMANPLGTPPALAPAPERGAYCRPSAKAEGGK